MKVLMATVVLFTALTAYSQTSTASMESQIRRELLQGHDRTLMMLPTERANEIRHGPLTYSGIFVELVKSDNRLQLINPMAPPQYGSSWDNVVFNPSAEPAGSGREGLKLFAINF